MVDLRLCCCDFGWCIVVWFVLVFVACDCSGLVVLVWQFEFCVFLYLCFEYECCF